MTRAGRGKSLPKRAALADAIDSYLLDLTLRVAQKTAKEARSALEQIRRETGWTLLDDVDRAGIDRWRRRQVEAGAANRSINRKVGNLRACLGYSVETGLIERDPLQGLRVLPTKGRHRRRVARALSDADMAKLLAAAEAIDAGYPDRFPRAPLLRLLSETGSRWHETVQATWADLDVDRSVLHLRAESTKTQEARAVPLLPGSLARLVALRAAHTRVCGSLPTATARIFLSPLGEPWAASTGRIGKFLGECLRRAGLPKHDASGRVFHIHALRKSFISRAARGGMPVHMAARITGIRTIQVLSDHYLDVQGEELANALRMLPPVQ